MIFFGHLTELWSGREGGFEKDVFLRSPYGQLRRIPQVVSVAAIILDVHGFDDCCTGCANLQRFRDQHQALPVDGRFCWQVHLQNPQAHQCDQRYLPPCVDLQFPQYCYR